MNNSSLIAEIDAYLHAAPARSREVVPVGPFICYFHHGSDMPELTYARPVVPLPPDAEIWLPKVCEEFESRNRVFRWEYLLEATPELTAVLTGFGLPEPEVRPLMVVTRESFRPETTHACTVRMVVPGETEAVNFALHRAFSGLDTPPDEPDFLARLIEMGSTAVAAYVDGVAVGGGIHNPVGTVTEVAGIGVVAEFRKRGIAGSITSALVRHAFDSGCETVFLSAADETVQRVYARIGFELVGAALDTAARKDEG